MYRPKHKAKIDVMAIVLAYIVPAAVVSSFILFSFYVVGR